MLLNGLQPEPNDRVDENAAYTNDGEDARIRRNRLARERRARCTVVKSNKFF